MNARSKTIIEKLECTHYIVKHRRDNDKKIIETRVVLLLACLFGFSGCYSEEADMSQKAVHEFLTLALIMVILD